ncbi:ribokinase [Streptomyces sp. MMS24-I31]|uniref:ribokinase n=1 Tax=Streptomyces sp. MMS24-I31 TaxID=3351563 RepID=UPI003896ED5D
MYDYDLLVVGSANADLVIGVERRPGAGETVLGSDLAVHPGGKGANQAVAAARLGARTALLARVGDDAHGRLLLDSQRAAGVDPAGVLVGGAPTGVALITVDPSGDNSIVVSPGANGRLTPGDVRAAAGLLRASRVVSAQLEIPLETVVETVRHLAPAGRFVLNPSPPRPLPQELLDACDPLIVNEHEAKVILGGSGSGSGSESRSGSGEISGSGAGAGSGSGSGSGAGAGAGSGSGSGSGAGAGAGSGSGSGEGSGAGSGEGSWSGFGAGEGSGAGEGFEVSDGPEGWARALLARGPRSVVVTLGAQGALVASPEGVARVPSVEVDAVDTTGAGDAFTAALAWRLGAGATLAQAAAYAARVGAVAVTRPGAQESFPTAAEVDTL